MSSDPHHYRLFGLTLASPVPLDALPLQPTDDTDVDVELRFEPAESFWRDASRGAEPYRRVEINEDRLEIDRTTSGWLWRYPDETDFFVGENADLVALRWPEHYVLADALTYLLGPVFGFVLRLRGVRSLHASTAMVNGRAVSFVGPRGAGKSTLVAQMYRRDHAVLTEDVTAFARDGRLLPGPPLVKLWDDSARAHGDLPLVTPNWTKRYLPVSDRIGSTPVSSSAFYLLEVGDALGVEPVGPSEALATLLQNVYVPYVLSAQMRSDDLEFFGTLVERARVRRLTRTESLDDVAALAKLVERDVETLEQ